MQLAHELEKHGEDLGQANVLFKLSKLLYVKGFIPSDVYQNLDPSIELEEGLRRRRFGERSLQGAECEHGPSALCASLFCAYSARALLVKRAFA